MHNKIKYSLKIIGKNLKTKLNALVLNPSNFIFTNTAQQFLD